MTTHKPKIVSLERYKAIRRYHKMNPSGGYCVVCGMSYFSVSIRKCEPRKQA